MPISRQHFPRVNMHWAGRGHQMLCQLGVPLGFLQTALGTSCVLGVSQPVSLCVLGASH